MRRPFADHENSTTFFIVLRLLPSGLTSVSELSYSWSAMRLPSGDQVGYPFPIRVARWLPSTGTTKVPSQGLPPSRASTYETRVESGDQPIRSCCHPGLSSGLS